MSSAVCEGRAGNNYLLEKGDNSREWEEEVHTERDRPHLRMQKCQGR